jgi:asparagine synthase (glutamine-hydrolysing)
MCGIAGFIDFNQKSEEKTIIAMTNSLAHRGPDDKGYKVWYGENAHIGFGHRRLSIIDLSPLGHQPMYSKSGRWAIIFNGEIYNYQEIKADLLDLGYKFHSHSDTEVIIQAFDCWGKKAVDRFIGMFAFALYDTKEEVIHIFRDRAGVKPLYYYWKDNVFLFASELKAFHEHPRFKKDIDLDALALYFSYTYIPAPYSIFKDTYKLTPGHSLTFSLTTKKFEIEKYWDVYDYYAKPALKISKEDALQETKSLLKSSCEYRMVADVPVGIFLSGGYDSGITTALLQQDRTEKLKTFTIGYENKTFNETEEAKQVAEHLGTDHTEYICSTQEAVSILSDLPFFYDEPLGDTSIIPTTLVSQLARKSVTVALSADAGDETFAGYHRHEYIVKQQKYLKYVPNFLAKMAAGGLSMINPTRIPILKNAYNISSRHDKVVNLLKNNSVDNAYKQFLTFFLEKDVRELIKKPINFQPTAIDTLPPDGHGGDAIQAMLAIDYKSYMVDCILAKVDRATMSVSLEGREPLLDHRIIEFAAQLPSTFKYNEGVKKVLLKEIVHGMIPPEKMVKRKMGFGAPVHSWFKDDIAKDMLRRYLDPHKIEKQGILNHKVVEKLIKDYLEGKIVDFNKIWLLLVFQMWYEKWMQSTPSVLNPSFSVENA